MKYGGAIVILIFAAFALWANSGNETEAEETSTTLESEEPTNQYITGAEMPTSMSFCGDNVPLEKYHVRESLDRELIVNSYRHSNTIRMLKLAPRYFPTIERILAEEGLPDDLKFVTMAESDLVMESASPAGAKGLWQIMKATGKEGGLECAIEIDERFHLEKATRLAAKYLKSAHAKFGDWATAVAAYNAGRSRIIQQLDKQGQESYYDLYLNTETARYVYRILALKEIYTKPSNYGFFIDEQTKYHEVASRIVEVKKIDNMFAFAKEQGTNYKELKLLNPWLRSSAVEPRRSGKVYQVKIPL